MPDLLYDHQKSNVRKRPFPTKPNEIVSIDFRADLKKSVKDNIHILTIVDNFSKLIKVYALQGRTAVTVSRFVYNSCLVYGMPEKICLDQDPAFEANAFPQLMKQLLISSKQQVTTLIRIEFLNSQMELCKAFFWRALRQVVERTNLCFQLICIYINWLCTL